MLTPCPIDPEESWRRCLPQVFFPDEEETLSFSGKEPNNSEIWKVEFQDFTVSHATVTNSLRAQEGEDSQENRTSFTEKSTSHFISLLQEKLHPQNVSSILSELKRVCFVEINHNRARVLLASPLASQVSVRVVSKPFSPSSIYPQSQIGEALASRLKDSCPHELNLVFEKKKQGTAFSDDISHPLIIVFENLEPTFDQTYSNLKFIFEEGTKAEILLMDQGASFTHHRHTLVLKKEAQVDELWMVTKFGESALFERKVELYEKAQFRELQLFSKNSGKTAKVISNIHFKEEKASSEGGTAILSRKGLIDYEPLQEHEGTSGKSSLIIRMLAKERARLIFQGLIKVPLSGAHTEATQINKNILLSEKARIDAVPRLEILPNEVSCRHGSATAELDAKQVFFLRSRGFSQEQAEFLILQGFMKDSSHISGFINDLFEHELKKELEDFLKN